MPLLRTHCCLSGQSELNVQGTGEAEGKEDGEAEGEEGGEAEGEEGGEAEGEEAVTPTPSSTRSYPSGKSVQTYLLSSHCFPSGHSEPLRQVAGEEEGGEAEGE